jgi:hypothetical protein
MQDLRTQRHTGVAGDKGDKDLVDRRCRRATSAREKNTMTSTIQRRCSLGFNRPTTIDVTSDAKLKVERRWQTAL